MTKRIKTVLITGGVKRIGLSIARLLHANNYNIIITYNKSSKEAREILNELNKKSKDSCKIIKVDFSKIQNFSDFSKNVLKYYGRLDVLINNASRFYPTKINQVNQKSWLDLIDTNLKSPLMLAKIFYPELKKKRGNIINIIDIHIDPPLKDHIIYNISKAGLLALTKTLAKDLAPQVRVNGVSPGAIMWPEADENKTQKKREILSRIALKKIGDPLDIAKAVMFLVEDGNYITGQNINVDGGRRLNM